MDCPSNPAISVWSVCKNWWGEEPTGFQGDQDAEDSVSSQNSLGVPLTCFCSDQSSPDGSMSRSCPKK